MFNNWIHLTITTLGQSIHICTNDFTITNNTNAYNNELWSIRKIDSLTNDFMVIFNYLLNQIHKNHDCIITSITFVIILITKTTDNNSISTANYTNAVINLNNYHSNTMTNNGTNTTNSITTNKYKDLKSTTKFSNNVIIATYFQHWYDLSSIETNSILYWIISLSSK